MLKPAALALTAILSFSTTAEAGGRRVQYRQPGPAAGTVNNFYGPTNVYQGYAASAPSYGYDYSSAPAYGASYGYGNAYGDAYSSAYGSYGAPWGQPFAGGVGYSPYGYGAYGYGGYGATYGARLDPWNGYYGGPGNGYW
jgi:hypothetical protein